MNVDEEDDLTITQKINIVLTIFLILWAGTTIIWWLMDNIITEEHLSLWEILKLQWEFFKGLKIY